MQFDEAQRRQADLAARLRQGTLSPSQYAEAVGKLQVMDPRGVWWQPSPDGTGWLRYDGTRWLAAIPPVQDGRQSPAGANTPPERPKDFNEFKSSLMSVDDFKKISKEVPLAKRPQKWWDLLSILGGIVGAILWFLYGGIRSGREGFDLITPLLMIAIPVFLVWFRADIDQMLQPLQPTRRKISKIILIGLGIATPFLTAWILYNIFHFSEYPLMQANILLGTLVSYAIVRDPVLAKGNRRLPAAGIPAGIGIVSFALLISMLAVPVMADDCMRDPLNAQDCLRTGGFAEGIAGTAGAGLGVLVNGPVIVQGIVQGGAGAAAGAGTAAGSTPATPGTSPQAQALINRRDQLVQQQAELRKRWFERKALEEAVRKAKLLDKKHGIRAVFLGGKKIVEGITDPKGQIYEGVKDKLGIETPLDKMKDGFWGKEVEMKDVGKDWKAARDEYQRLKAQLDGMPSQRDMLDQNNSLNQQINQINTDLQKLSHGGK